MGRAHYFATIVDRFGRPVPNVVATARQLGTTTPITETIYAARTGGATLTNPIAANDQGELEFWLDAPKRLDLFIQATSLTSETQTVDVTPDAEDIETETGSQARVDAHAAAGDPHPAYETSAEAQAKVETHEALATAHPFVRNTIRRAAGLYKSFPVGSTYTSTQETNNIGQAYPVDIPEDVTIDRMGVEVTTAGSVGSVVRMGIYDDDGTGKSYGARLLDAGTVDATTVGNKENAVSQSLPKGRYWFVSVSQGGATTQPFMRSSQLNHGLETVNNPTYVAATYSFTVTGALPSTLPAPSASARGHANRIFVRLV